MDWSMEDGVADDDIVSVALLMAASAVATMSCFLFEYYVYLGG
jgi:hypothetical protein